MSCDSCCPNCHSSSSETMLKPPPDPQPRIRRVVKRKMERRIMREAICNQETRECCVAQPGRGVRAAHATTHSIFAVHLIALFLLYSALRWSRSSKEAFATSQLESC